VGVNAISPAAPTATEDVVTITSSEVTVILFPVVSVIDTITLMK
jgi:hypothetical protein